MPRPKQENPESIEAMARRLSALRKALSMTQTEIAATVGRNYGNQSWANWESGYCRISVDHALVLCRRYGVTMDWVYRGHTERIRPDLLARINAQEPELPAPHWRKRLVIGDGSPANSN